MSYANPEVLVNTEWVAKNLANDSIKLVEVDYDPENGYKKSVNVVMIAQGSSELNLVLVVKDSESKAVVQSLHDEFNLSQVN